MRIRRCAVVWLEAREVARFRMEDLLSGGTGIVGRLCWIAHAPHLPAPVEVDADQVRLLGAVGPVDWVEREPLEAQFGPAAVAALLASTLLLAQRGEGAPLADDAYRRLGWHAPAAVAHMAARWEGVDAPRTTAQQDLDSSAGLLRRFGVPPPADRPRVAAAPDVALPAIARDGFDELLDTRTTCRNFDATAEVPLATFSQLMARVFGARGRGHPAPGFEVYKRTSPSGGSLHPTECWLVVQRVAGIEPGLYHYRVDRHALAPVRPCSAAPQPGETRTRALAQGEAGGRWRAAELRAFATIAVAGQTCFADAAVLCILAPRFQRNFWKYRNHAKAYRVTVLDVGHLSQTLQLCATQAGLGPFITAAINEVDIERAFGLDGRGDGALAVCGFGVRAARAVRSEFDPNRKAWPR